MNRMIHESHSSISHPLKLPYFPEEIITELLTCLPVKTLIRFKSVSKSWLCSISNPNFIDAHRVKSSHNTNHRLILGHFYIRDYYYLKLSSLESIFDLPSSDITTKCVVELDYHVRGKLCHSLVKIVGSCNGLVCVATGIRAIFIWNPSTNESKMLPAAWDIKHWRGVLSTYGFGYDHVNDDYKVVWIVYHAKYRVSLENPVMVYSLKTNSWKKIGAFQHAISHNYAGKLVNGVLHWAVKSSGGRYARDIILTLDLGNETYGKIAQPEYESRRFDWSLSVLNGWLCVTYDSDVICADVWVMKEYGVRDSWVKFCTIPYVAGLESFVFSCDSPLCLSMKGEVLLKDRKEVLVLYDPKSGTFRYPKTPKLIRCLSGLNVTTYLESLVSPNIFDGLHTPKH